MEEPSVDEAVEVIRGVKEYYEAYHHVTVPDTLVRSTVQLSERYITDRFLPDKAIDLLDEACACCSLRHPEISEWLDAEKQVNNLTAQKEEQEQAKEGPDYEVIARLNYEIEQAKQQVQTLQEKVEAISVGMEDIAKVIELWTGIPDSNVKET